MNRSSPGLRIFAAMGAALAGYVDAIGFLETNGYFVSFMSGNSTRLGVGLVHAAGYGIPALLIGCFVFGVVFGSVVGRKAKHRQIPVVFATVACFLIVAAGLKDLGLAVGTMPIVAMAMGIENAAIEANGEVRIGLTYMTGALVKLGQHLASALQSGHRWAWLPHFLLWSGMAAGVVAGALCYPLLGSDALWPASAVALLLAAAAWRWPRNLALPEDREMSEKRSRS